MATRWKGCIRFGSTLLATEDLDPVYIAIWGASLDEDVLCRLLVAYWCLYHLGVSASLAERYTTPRAFWEALQVAAANPRLAYPRGSERRHWRGKQAVDSARELAARYKSPIHVISDWAEPGTFAGVTERVQQSRGFGPWIAFKVADMLERVAAYDIDFSDCELGFYKEPRAGAAAVLGVEHADDDQLKQVLKILQMTLGYYTAPPAHDRPINVQELETILCKFKSFLHGHYPLGKDTREIHHGLIGWGDLATELKNKLPKGVRDE